MAKRAPVKFRVGQRVILVLEKYSRWERANGERGIVIGPKRRAEYQCGPLGGGSGPRETRVSDRYAVRWGGGVNNFLEYQLRAVYEGEPMSTWAKFEKTTGLRLDRGRFAAVRPASGRISKTRASA